MFLSPTGSGELLQVEPDGLLLGEPGGGLRDLDGRLLRRGALLRAGARRLPRRRRPRHIQSHGGWVGWHQIFEIFCFSLVLCPYTEIG